MADYWETELGEMLHALVEATDGSGDERKAIDALVDYVASEHYCEETIHHGSRNPDAPNFGPDEYCEELAEPGSDRCPAHRGIDP